MLILIYFEKNGTFWNPVAKFDIIPNRQSASGPRNQASICQKQETGGFSLQQELWGSILEARAHLIQGILSPGRLKKELLAENPYDTKS